MQIKQLKLMRIHADPHTQPWHKLSWNTLPASKWKYIKQKLSHNYRYSTGIPLSDKTQQLFEIWQVKPNVYYIFLNNLNFLHPGSSSRRSRYKRTIHPSNENMRQFKQKISISFFVCPLHPPGSGPRSKPFIVFTCEPVDKVETEVAPVGSS